jgi:hypothetical protein
MPSPRAVLADLTKMSLNTKKPWSTIGKNGHLSGNVPVHVTETPLVVKEAEVAESTVVADVHPVVLEVEDTITVPEHVVTETIDEVQDLGLDIEDPFKAKKKKKLV